MGKAGGKVAEATTKAIVKKLDEVAVEKAEAKILTDRMKEVAFHKDDNLFQDVAEKMIAAERSDWKDENGKTLWPPENGKVPGTGRIVELQEGQRLDRFGGTTSKSGFLAPADTPLDKRALSPTTDLSVRDEYVVVKPFKVEQSNVMPWFGKEGMGLQFETVQGSQLTIQELVKQGYLKKVSP